MTQRVRLGELTCPSGELVVIDGGYLGVWSGDRSPADIDPILLGVEDPAAAADVRGAVDFEVVGPDAAAAARFLARRQPTQSLYDVPASSATAFVGAFETLCQDNGLDATLRATGRVPHRKRVRRAATGAFHTFGVPAVAVAGLPTDRPLWVMATAADDEDLADGRWLQIELMVGLPGGWAGDEEDRTGGAASEPLGTVGVDFARLAFADADALGAWEHDRAIDGLADVAFWGLSQEEAAQANGAQPLSTPGDAGTYGWVDLPLAQAVGRAEAVLAWAEAQPDRKLMVDFRPHSHHWQVMREVRASPTSSGTVQVGSARILFAMTGHGDGLFPVYADRDADGTLVAIRVTLA